TQAVPGQKIAYFTISRVQDGRPAQSQQLGGKSRAILCPAAPNKLLRDAVVMPQHQSRRIMPPKPAGIAPHKGPKFLQDLMRKRVRLSSFRYGIRYAGKCSQAVLTGARIVQQQGEQAECPQHQDDYANSRLILVEDIHGKD